MKLRDRWPVRPGRRGVDDEVDGELSFHLEMRRRELMAQGHSAAEAERVARAMFGDLEAARSRMRTLGYEREERTVLARVATTLRDVVSDTRLAGRQMRAAPGWVLLAIGTLALGIGATTAIFSAVQAVVLRPLPVPDPARVVAIGETRGDSGLPSDLSAGNFVDMAAAQTAFDAVATAVTTSLTLGHDDGAVRVLGTRASGRYFDVFAVTPQLGRVFGPAEDEPGRDQVAVLSDRFWASQFGRDPEVLGRTLLIDGRPHTVIGVMPASFDFTADSEALWVPIAFTLERKATHDEHYLAGYGRLRQGVALSSALAELDAIGRRLAERYPLDNGGRTLTAVPLLDLLVTGHRERLLVLLGSVGFVLLIACGNVSNLLLARGSVRARELALRTALGAGRSRLLRQLLTESLVLGVAGAVAGVALAAGVIRLLVAFAPPGVPRLEQAGLDVVVLVFAVMLALATSLLFGVVPAWRASRTDAQVTLRDATRGAGARGPRDIVRSMLVAGEVALAVVLLSGAALFVESAIAMQRQDPGFDPDGVFSARFSLPATSYPDGASLMAAARTIREAVAALPGVRSAAVTSAVPGFGGFYNGLLPDGVPPDPRSFRQSRARFVTPEYFQTMTVPIVRGRALTAADREGTELVMVVNQTLAERLFPGEDPVGRRVQCCTGGAKVIVGVAGDVRPVGPADPIESEFYLPLSQVEDVAWSWMGRTLFVVAETGGDPASLRLPVHQAITTVNRGIPVWSEMPMTDRLARTIDTERFNTGLLMALSAVGLVLAAVGIFGVIAYFAAQRTSEIGIRLALGASRGSVVWLIARQVAVPVASGVAVGTTAAWFASRLIASDLVGVSPTDVSTYAGAVAAIGFVAALAAIVPARRAAALDPARTLGT